MKEILFFFLEFLADVVCVTSDVRHGLCCCCCVGFSLIRRKFSCRVMLIVHRYLACLWNTLCLWRLLNSVTCVVVFRDLYVCVLQNSNT